MGGLCTTFEKMVKEEQTVERTFIAVKPDGVQRGLVGEIMSRFEKKGLKLVACKLIQVTKEFAEKHYADLSKKPVFAMVWEGLNAAKTGRALLGATNPADSLPGTIRGDLCVGIGRNVCHGSDSPDSAKAEISLWFKPEELCNWNICEKNWVYEL